MPQYAPYSAAGHSPRPALTSTINGLRVNADLHAHAERRKPLAPGEALLTSPPPPVRHTASFQGRGGTADPPPILPHGGAAKVCFGIVAVCLPRFAPCNAASLAAKVWLCGCVRSQDPLPCDFLLCYGKPAPHLFPPTLDKNNKSIDSYGGVLFSFPRPIPGPCLFFATSLDSL